MKIKALTFVSVFFDVRDINYETFAFLFTFTWLFDIAD